MASTVIGTNFVNAEGRIIRVSNMTDEHQLIKIVDKMPIIKDIGKIVCGDINSNILTFEINRYYDGIDLRTKSIKFLIKTDSFEPFSEDAVDIQYNQNLLRFSWVLSDSVTYKSGAVTAAIVFIGSESDKSYLLKTLPFTITIDNSLDFLDDSPPPVQNWFFDVETKMAKLELELNNLGSSMDSGTIGDDVIVQGTL